MPFPTIPTTAGSTLAGLNQLNTTATLTGPNLSALTKGPGDLIIAIAGEYQSSAGTDAAYTGWAGGGLTWNEIRDSTGTAVNRLGVAYARAVTGSETGTVTVTRSGTLVGDAAMILMVIPGAHASAAPEATVMATASNAGANPASLSPSWGADDTLWIAVSSSGMTSATGSWTGTGSAPANYSGFYSTAPTDTSTIGDCDLAVAFRQVNAASEDAAAFTVDTSNNRNSALVIAVRPAPSLSASPNDPVGITDSAAVVQQLVDTVNDAVGVTDGASGAAFGYTESAAWDTTGTYNTNTQYKDVDVAVTNGDLIAVIGLSSNCNGGTGALATLSGSTSAWTKLSENNLNGTPGYVNGYAEATATGTVTIRVTIPATATPTDSGVAVWTIPAGKWTAAPTSSAVMNHSTNGQISATLSGTSTVLQAVAGWNALLPVDTTTVAGATIRERSNYDGLQYGVFVADWVAQAAGTRAYGPETGASNDYSGALLIVPGDASGGGGGGGVLLERTLPQADSVGITDSVTADLTTPGLEANPADPVGVTDTAAAERSLTRALNDPVGAADSIALSRSVTIGSRPAPRAVYAFTGSDGAVAVDYSGNGNDGSYVGSATSSTDALYLTGSPTPSSYVSVPQHSSIEPATALTVMAWYKTVAHGPNRYLVAVAKSRSGVSDSYALYTHCGNNDMPAVVVSTSVTDYVLQTGQTVSDEQWHHLALTYDGATLTAWLDGTSVASTPATGTIAYQASPLTLGGSYYFPDESLAGGYVDDVRIFAQALSGPEIVDWKNTTAPSTPAGGTEAVGVTDAAALTRALTAADPAGATDAVALEQQRTAADPVGVSDAPAAQQALDRAPADAVGATDAYALGVTRNPSDQVGLTDAVDAQLVLGGTSYDRTPDDPVGVTDATALERSTASSDAVGATDAIALVRESPSSDAVGVTDVATAATTFLRSPDDPVGISDATALAQTRAASDTVGVTDSVSALLVMDRTVDDAVGVVDALAVSRETSLADLVGATDAASPQANLSRSLAETVGVTDAVQIETGLPISADDTVAVTDNASTTLNAARTTPDTVGVSDAVALGRATSAADAVGVTDAAASSTAYLRDLDDPVGVSDAVSVDLQGASSLLAEDAVGVSDAVEVILVRHVTVNDLVGISDTAAKQTLREVLVADAVGLTDSVSSAGIVDYERAHIVWVPQPPQHVVDLVSQRRFIIELPAADPVTHIVFAPREVRHVIELDSQLRHVINLAPGPRHVVDIG